LTGAIIVLFSLIFLKCIKSEEAIEEAVNEEKEKKDTKVGFLILIPQVLIGFGAGLFVPYMNLYFKNLFKLGADKIGIIFSTTSFVMFISALIAPFLTKIMKKIKVLILTQGLSIPFMIAIALSDKILISAASHIIRTSLMNMAQPLLSNVSMESVSMQYQKILNASITLSWNLSFALSNLLGGYLIQTKGFTLPILISTILYTILNYLKRGLKSKGSNPNINLIRSFYELF
jgi:MFS family permease